MDEQKVTQHVEDLKKKLTRAQRQLAGLKEKARLLEMQYDDARTRESKSGDLVMELIERQHELNVMLNRSQTMLSRTQEAMALTSLEFNEMAKALPEPKKAEFSDRIAKINDLFKQTGIEDADLLILNKPVSAPEPEEEEATETIAAAESTTTETRSSRWEFFWKRKQPHEAEQVDAEIMDDSGSQAPAY